LRERLRARPPAPPRGRPVLLYTDTFTNFFEPEIGEAAVAVLEAAGFHVELPPVGLCCGRPLYDHGFLRLAKRLLRRNLRGLHGGLARGLPIVGLEPSCVATFRDELPALFPGDPEAQRLAGSVFTLAELLSREAPDWQPAPLRRRALVQGHCHHQAVMGMQPDLALLSRLGLDWELLDSGCCGLAGSFGFTAEHYDVSMACGERKLLPQLRAAATDTLVLADGFSCRTQITHGSGRQGLHLAQVLDIALREERRALP
jgi:Fe-S oxidoreductase